ncbi:glycerol-3-phosphate dehydrogenase subunit GlpB [Desulfobacula sp.]|uniref:glycerol-3-phosphate dehydrogenase subunit GlpB n=1 Tax=Desulfobacula sp. TaxID=2593537 RepID=UPI002620A1D9|nr:glycerol-3-phosphate dehydrogenase subunit GlpB [Desulfobacula sp.]
MKDKKYITCDITVIGAGFAGMVAAARASALGLKTVQTGNSSQLYFASGLFDFLGVYPLHSRIPLKDPRTGLELLQKEMPDHPYSKTGLEAILKSFDFLARFLQSTGLNYVKPDKRNRSVLTAAGTFKPTCMIPETISKGCLLKNNTPLLLVDFKGLKGFCAGQMADVLKKIHPNILTLSVDVPGEGGDLNPTYFATLFEDSSFLKKLATQISPFLDKVELMGMPAVCGVNKSLDALTRLEKMTGLDIFEIPMMPPSIPGLRLKNAFEKKLAENNVHFLTQAKIKSPQFNGSEFVLDAVNQNMETQIRSRGVILATGRFPGGGLHAQRGYIQETVFNLPVYQPDKRSLWHHINFFEQQGHMINTAGVETDNVFRPVDTHGAVVYENLYAIGTILAHNDWVRLKSGSGVSAVSAFTSVNDFYKKSAAGH